MRGGTGRVAVTGLGAVTPIGIGVERFWPSLCGGRSGIGSITGFDASRFRVRIAAEVREWEPDRVLEARQARRLDRFAQFALAAAIEAWQSSCLSRAAVDPYDVGVLIGSSHGGEASLLSEMGRIGEPGARVHPRLIPRMLGNMAAAAVAVELGLCGPSFALASACATGGHAIGEACEIVRRGDAVAMLCGAAEAAITPLTLAGDLAAGALSCRDGEPERASRPLDLDRDGFVLGEGAGVLVVEDMEHALQRGARILAEVRGYSATSDAWHETRPDPEGRAAAHALTRAMARADVGPDDVGAVYLHATGTLLGDPAEARALEGALGERARHVPVTAIKGSIGHLLGASGAVQAVAAVQTLRTGMLPPTRNLDRPDPACSLNASPHGRTVSVRHVLSNSFGFGGHNAVLVLSRHEVG